MKAGRHSLQRRSSARRGVWERLPDARLIRRQRRMAPRLAATRAARPRLSRQARTPGGRPFYDSMYCDSLLVSVLRAVCWRRVKGRSRRCWGGQTQPPTGQTDHWGRAGFAAAATTSRSQERRRWNEISVDVPRFVPSESRHAIFPRPHQAEARWSTRTSDGCDGARNLLGGFARSRGVSRDSA